MERKIGETFEYACHKLKVVDKGDSKCDECFFYNKNCTYKKNVTGFCSKEHRTDMKSVMFVKYNEAKPQKLNLCEILKDCPQGETLWSPMLGDVKFLFIDEERQMIFVETIKGLFTWEINADGTISIDEVTSPEIMLFPSKDQRDWSKFTAPWLKKERFDPKTLQSFDRVLVRNNYFDTWICSFFSHQKEEEIFPFFTATGLTTKFCIPYNDETKHLVGTIDQAPEYYRY